ncbi:MAG: lactonase family protein [Bacteroidota bacterium]|nr:lactonase family protein [Bacteroidota bacterium]
MKIRVCFPLIILSFLISCQSDSGKDSIRFYIGTYAEKSDYGILSCQLDIRESSIDILSSTSGVKNPSFLAMDPKGESLYAVSEVDDFSADNYGGVFAFRMDPVDGSLSLINSIHSGGAHPCHLTIHPSGSNLYVANYSGGNISSIQISSSGELLTDVQTIQHLGSGPNKARQDKAHAHSVNLTSGGLFLYACDLGIDQVVAYSITPQSKRLKPRESVALSMASGSGPRHMAFSQDERLAFIINELNSTITICSNDPETGKIVPLQSVSTLPEDYKGENYCADIHVHPNKAIVYASNRGHNSIAVFKLDSESGGLNVVQYQDTKGDWPRNFAIDPEGRVLLVANQRSDNVVVFRIDKHTGLLEETNVEMAVSKPVCILFFNQV